MITIDSKTHCCGCSACAERCPKKCITLMEDNEWFLYPRVNTELCIDCGLCDKVCPVIHTPRQQNPENSYSALNTNETDRLASSSGGIFISLARNILDNGGIVFGAVFSPDYQKVSHTYAEDMEGVKAMMGSKYLQSDINLAYIHCEDFLKKGRLVLFTGTPCQIAGLNTFLRRDYSNLVTADFICHGVPSPGVWRRYCTECGITDRLGNHSAGLQSVQGLIENISFRNKAKGWHNFGLSIRLNSSTNQDNKRFIFAHHRKNEYMRSFLNDLSLRPICYDCPFKGGKSGSDFTLADFWGIEKIRPDIDDDKGVSLVIVKSKKASEIITDLNIEADTIDLEDALRFNPAYNYSVSIPQKRALYFKLLQKGKSINVANQKCLSPSIRSRIKVKLSNILYRLSHI